MTCLSIRPFEPENWYSKICISFRGLFIALRKVSLNLRANCNKREENVVRNSLIDPTLPMGTCYRVVRNSTSTALDMIEPFVKIPMEFLIMTKVSGSF